MGLFDRVEARLASTINGAFARAFKAEVQPVEIAAAIRKAMDDKAAILAADRAIVPNRYIIELAPSDHERLTAYAELLTEELVASTEEHIASQHYRPAGPISITFDQLDNLETGVFRVRSTSAPGPRAASHGAVREGGTGVRKPGEVIETHRSGEADDPARRMPRNPPFPAEATADAEGPIHLASNAASAAAGAAAGTAAAAADLWENPRNDHPELTENERAAQRRRDLSAWGDDTPEVPAQPQRPEQPQPSAHRDARPGPAPDYQPGAAWAGSAADEGPEAGYEPTVAAPISPELADARRGLRPDPANRPWVDVDGDAYPLLSAISVVGRDPRAEITLDDSGISRRHCEIRVTHDGPHLVVGLRDLGSTNGTFVNGERVNTARLDEGDRVTIGRMSFVLHLRRR